MTFKKPKEETALATRIMFALSALPNVWVWENQIGVAVYDSGARVAYGLGGAGAPDLVVEVGYSPVGASPGSFIVVAVWLEVKLPHGTIQHDQKRWHAAARRGGRNVAVVRSVESARSVISEVQAYGRVMLAWEVEADAKR